MALSDIILRRTELVDATMKTRVVRRNASRSRRLAAMRSGEPLTLTIMRQGQLVELSMIVP